MYRFIETLRICNGTVCNLPYHNRRLNDTRSHFWQHAAPIDLAHYVSVADLVAATAAQEPTTVPPLPASAEGVFKARVVYGENGIEEVTYTPYTLRQVHSLALVADDDIDYTYKSTDREALNRLFARRGVCDDILIVKQGRLTDTSIANIALFDGHRWYTPQRPLLRGTKRAELLERELISEEELHIKDLAHFSRIRLFNALIDWGELELPMKIEKMF